MSAFRRPVGDPYFVEPCTEGFLQGDLFEHVPLAYPVPPDITLVEEGTARFMSGPFDSGQALLITPTCVMAAQGPDVEPGMYAHPVRTLVPVLPVERILDLGALTTENLGNLRSDRLRRFFYLPESGAHPERAALLHVPISVHHDIVAKERIAQLTGGAYQHLRRKLMAFYGSIIVDEESLGEMPADPRDRPH